MAMDLFNLLEEQRVFGFTGKVNALDGDSRQTLGHLTMSGGDIYSCCYRGRQGIKGLFLFYLENREPGKVKTIVEPEIRTHHFLNPVIWKHLIGN